MTTPMCEDGGLLREWAPLTKLLQQIPLKAQNGLFTQDVNFTCIDVVTEFIAVGTNHGLVYWYGREKGDLQRLRCENTNTTITCVKVISTVDYMVAAGNDQGIVTVFQIPKNPPDSLPDSLKPKQKKQVERYNIGGLHKKAVTTVEWSKNGMKLFSGDQDGLVVITEIDFYMHLSKSSELLNEKYPVVQLSYQQGLLLVSTVFRTILVNRNQNDKVSQVGQKERKTLGKLGATFGPRQSPVQEPIIYCSRPGVRLWQADKLGTVLKTLIFKDALQTGYTEVELLNPVSENGKKSRGEPTLGVVLPFAEDLLVTYSDDIVYVINPTNVGITSAVTDLRRVTSVACNKDEIFILEGNRNIIRVAYHPETETLLSEHVIFNIPKLDPTDIFIDVMTSPEIQMLLKRSTSTRKHIWTDVVWHCSQKGLEFGDNASEKARLKWLYLCNALKRSTDQKLRKKTFKTINPRHLARLSNFIKSGHHQLSVLDQQAGEENGKDKTEESQDPFFMKQEFRSTAKSDPVSIAKTILMAEQNQIEIDDARWQRRDKKLEDLKALFEQQALNWDLVANLLISEQFPGMETTDPLPSLAEISKPIAAGILELTSKLKESSIVPAIPLLKLNPSNLIQSISIMPTVTIGTDTTTVINGEEAVEVPQILPLDLETHLRIEAADEFKGESDLELGKESFMKKSQDERLRIFQKIGEQEFEDIVFTPVRKNKKFLRNCLDGNENGISDSAHSLSEPTYLYNMMMNNIEAELIKESPFPLSPDVSLLLETEAENILRDRGVIPFEDQLLSSVLYDYDQTRPVEGQLMTENSIVKPPLYVPYDNEAKNPSEVLFKTEKSNSLSVEVDCTVDSKEQLNGLITEHNEDAETDSVQDDDESYRMELKKLQELGECTQKILRREFNRPESFTAYDQNCKTRSRDEADVGSGSSAHKERNYALETQFNALSKEFVTSSNVEEEDWVIV